MKIGILTFHTAFNYGAMLQAYALQIALIRLGYDVQIIDYYPKDVENINFMKNLTPNPKQIMKYIYAKININVQKKISRFNQFRNRMQLTLRYYDTKELYLNPPEFDAYIVGSDQVWNMECGFNSFWFMDFVKAKRKISYAASFGTDSVPKVYLSDLKKQLVTFQSISVREHDGVSIIKEASGIEVTQVLDPTFLLSIDDWSELAAKRQFSGDYILVYSFSKSIEFDQLIRNVKKRFKLPVVAIAVGAHFPFDVDKCFNNTGPYEFLALFRDAKAICTDSFHGLAFSIQFRKTFFTIPHLTRNSRLDSLLRLINLRNRQFANPAIILELLDEELTINYEEAEALLIKSKNDSICFLKESLEA